MSKDHLVPLFLLGRRSKRLSRRLVPFIKDANGKIVREPLKNLSFIKRGWGTGPLLKLRRGSAPPPSARAPSSLLQHWLKCCVHLHLERHIKFAAMSTLVVLGWAHEKSNFWVGHYHKLTFTLSLDCRSFHWHCFIMLFMVPVGWHCLFIERCVGPVGNNHTHISSTIIKWGENS